MTTTEEVQLWLEGNERTQAWLAQKAGVSQAMVSLFLNGYKRASPDLLGRLRRVMKVYGLPPTEKGGR